jgi:hypothetical protein
MLKALDGGEKEGEYVARVVKSPPRMAIDHFASHTHIEPKSSNTGLIVIGAGAAVLLIGLVVALSGNGNTPNQLPVKNKTSNKELPPQAGGKTSWELTKEVKSFTQDEINKISEAYSVIEKSINSQQDPFKKDTAKLEQFKNSREMSEGMKANIDRKINSIITARVSMAKAELDKYKAHATGLVKEWKLKEVLEYLDTFPEKYSNISGIALMLEEEKARVREIIKHVAEYREVLKKAEKLIQEGKYNDSLKLLSDKSKGRQLPPDLVSENARIKSKADNEIQKKKAEEDKRIALQLEKEKAVQRKRERKYKETRESGPVHFANWTGALPSLTANFKVEGAKHGKHSKKYNLLFPKSRQGNITVKIELGEKPEIALLKIIPSGGQSSTALVQVPVAVYANEIPGNIETSKVKQGGLIIYDIDLTGCINKGKNTLEIQISPAAEPFMLAKIELRLYLPEEQLKKEKTRARATRRKLLAAAKREERKKRKNGNGKKKKKAVQWPPSIQVGKTVSIFNGKDLSCWKTVGRGQWTVKDGTIIGINTSGQPARLNTSFPGQNTWKDYEIELEVVLVRGELFVGMHGTIDNAGGHTGSELGPSLTPNKLTTVRVRIAGTKMYIKVDDRAEAMANGDSRFPTGGPYIVAEPNTEIHVKSVKFTLRSK